MLVRPPIGGVVVSEVTAAHANEKTEWLSEMASVAARR